MPKFKVSNKPAREVKAKNPLAMGNEKGFAAFYGQKPVHTTLDFLTNLGMVEPGIVNKIMGGVPEPEKLLPSESYNIDDLDNSGIRNHLIKKYNRTANQVSRKPVMKSNTKLSQKMADKYLEGIVKKWKKIHIGEKLTKTEARNSFNRYYNGGDLFFRK